MSKDARRNRAAREALAEMLVKRIEKALGLEEESDNTFNAQFVGMGFANSDGEPVPKNIDDALRFLINDKEVFAILVLETDDGLQLYSKDFFAIENVEDFIALGCLLKPKRIFFDSDWHTNPPIGHIKCVDVKELLDNSFPHQVRKLIDQHAQAVKQQIKSTNGCSCSCNNQSVSADFDSKLKSKINVILEFPSRN